MRVHRGSLFWGLFFLCLGAIPLADRAGIIDVRGLGGLARLWPVVIIAIGVMILASRTRLAVLGTVVAAVLVGGLAGLGLASGGWFVSSPGCGPGPTTATASRSGPLDAGATVSLDLSCGTLEVTTQAGNDWALQAGYLGAEPAVSVSGSRLGVTTPRASERQEWRLAVPAERIATLDATINAASARLDLSGASLSRLRVDVNAGDLVVVTDAAGIGALDATANAARLRITLGGPTSGTIRTNAGGLDLCVPADARLEIVMREQNLSGSNLADRGLSRSGETWTRPGSGPLIHLEVAGNVSGLTLEPTGGCR